MKYSIVMLMQDEKQFLLEKAVRSALLWADELVIVDGGSKDDSIAYLWEKLHHDKRIKVISQPFTEPASYTDNKNLAIQYATGDWILSLDADEILDDNAYKLKQEIENSPNVDMWTVEGTHYFYDMKHVDATVDRHWFLNRLFKRGVAKYPDHTMHGLPTPQSNIMIGISQAGIMIHHYGYVKDLIRHELRNFYTNMKTLEIHKPEDLIWMTRTRLDGTYPVKEVSWKHPRIMNMEVFGL
jgi:glycosyltransferase involved in cell wall biosynthesis